VSSSAAFKWSFVVVTLLSLVWKTVIPTDTPKDLRNELVEFFQRNHFDVAVTESVLNDMPIMTANTAACHLQIARVPPDGSYRDLIRSLGTGTTDRIFIVFRGRVYTQQPISWTVLAYLWSRFLRELGFIRHITPVIAVVANSSCEAERLPWSELRGAS
jgi:hypothetical protein